MVLNDPLGCGSQIVRRPVYNSLCVLDENDNGSNNSTVEERNNLRGTDESHVNSLLLLLPSSTWSG